jgi:alpha-galactosidase
MNYKVNGGNAGAKTNLTEYHDGGIDYLKIDISLKETAVPKREEIVFSIPSIDCHSVFSPAVRYGRSLQPEWAAQVTKSRLAAWAPIHQLVSKSGQNRLLIALSDAAIPAEISTGVCEETAEIICKIALFTAPVSPRKNYSALIRLDMRNIKYYDAVYSAVSWWESDCGYKQAYIPDAAREPVDSLWYSFHQVLNSEKIIKECENSKALGMETVIVDDGWQCEDNNRGYAYTGDWLLATSKIPDMKALSDSIHQIGMKIMIWYSVPFVGKHSEKFKEFKDMLLNINHEEMNCYSLDPRYKKVRDYLVKTYTDAVKNWNLDGLKLDFIDWFKLYDESIASDPRRDFSSLEDGIDALLREVKEKLSQINPDILIEFRQTYIGPCIRKYGNMLRVTDCPGDAFKNRVDSINLRLTSGDTAIHSDMMMWNTNEPVEAAALQIASCLYCVPQISVLVDKLPEDHKKMLKFYLSFWKQNKDVLLGGKLTAENPEDNFSIAAATLGDSSVITSYSNRLVEVKTEKFAAVNASGADSLIIKGASGKNYKVLDCCGEEIGSGKLENLSEIHVPMSGMIVSC